jgi:hypothetical protein
MRPSEWAEFVGEDLVLKTKKFVKITNRLHFSISSIQTLAPYHNMGRRAKHFTAVDKALAAKAYDFQYSQSPT